MSGLNSFILTKKELIEMLENSFLLGKDGLSGRDFRVWLDDKVRGLEG